MGDAAGALGVTGGGAAADIVVVAVEVVRGGENADLKSGWIWASGSDEPRAPWLWEERVASNTAEAAYAMLFAAASAVESCCAGWFCSALAAVCAFATPFAAAASTCFWRAKRLASASKSSKEDEATGTFSVDGGNGEGRRGDARVLVMGVRAGERCVLICIYAGCRCLVVSFVWWEGKRVARATV